MKLKRNRIRKGLTLIETGVVVMILGLLIMYVSYTLANFIRPSVGDTTDKFKQVLVYCYRTAMLHNEAVLLKINLDEQNYSGYRILRSDDGIKEKKIVGGSFPSSSKIRAITDIRGIKYEAGTISIPFTYTGVSEDFTFHFGDDSSTYKSVLLYRYNGKIVIKPGEVTRLAKEDKNGKSSFEELEEN